MNRRGELIGESLTDWWSKEDSREGVFCTEIEKRGWLYFGGWHFSIGGIFSYF